MPSAGMSKKDQSSRANIFTLHKQKGSRFYSMRLMYKGKRRRFSTGHSNLRDAKAAAKGIMADIQSRGFEEATRIHSKRRDEVPDDPKFAEFADIYREVSTGFDRPASRASRERYLRSLQRIMEAVKIGRVAGLDESKVEDFKAHYLRLGREKNRSEESIRTSLNGILRNAAAVFSNQAVQAYRRKGLDLKNPFVGVQMKGIRLKSYSPLPRTLVGKIWEESIKLRDGDPKATAPDEKLRPRDAIDFRKPHRDAYALFLLELGLGLRRNEADKAQWNWFFSDAEERRYIEIRETPFFIPKSKQSRVIPVDEALWDALVEVKSDDFFVVAGLLPAVRAPETELKSAVYRCDQAHRTLVAWLRKFGIDDPKPCHRLRKEFGSFVSTTLGLFHAQRFLGHSSPNVTSDYYAGLTELPQVSLMPAPKAPNPGKQQKATRKKRLDEKNDRKGNS